MHLQLLMFPITALAMEPTPAPTAQPAAVPHAPPAQRAQKLSPVASAAAAHQFLQQPLAPSPPAQQCDPMASPPQLCPDGAACPQCGQTSCACPAAHPLRPGTRLCDAALKASCDAARRDSASECAFCTGQHAQALKAAGCNETSHVEAFCTNQTCATQLDDECGVATERGGCAACVRCGDTFPAACAVQQIHSAARRAAQALGA
eukprot:SAG11_NODE_689_length_7713_cov_3.470055_6_plen_205_part_00